VAVSATQSVNFLLLGATLVLLFSVIFGLMYLLGQKSSPSVEVIPELVVAPVETPQITSQLSADKKTQTEVADQYASAKELASQSKAQPVDSKARPMPQATTPKSKDTTNDSFTYMSESMAKKAPVVAEKNRQVTKNKIDTASVPAPSTGSQIKEIAGESVTKTIRPLTSEQQAQVAFQNAVKMLGRGDESGAQQELETVLSIEPVHVRARETLAALLLNTGRVSEAAEKLREGLRLRPAATPLAKLYARVLVDQGDNDAAVMVLERAAPQLAADPNYYALLAVLYRGVGKHAQAAQVYQQMLKVQSGVAAWWMGLALSEDAMGESAQALAAFRRAQRAGGLKREVLQYVQSRITALTPIVSEKSLQVVANDSDDFED
jgi:MSHA biogenesis protein MshN